MGASDEHNVLVVIIGAGLSGLRAAVELEKAGVSYVILEAMDRVGGRTLSISSLLPTEDRIVELGAAWLNDSNQSEMYALSKEFGFKLVKQRAEGISLYQYMDGRVESHPYEQPCPLTEEQGLQFLNFVEKFSEYINRSNLEQPYLGPDAAELDSMNVQDFTEQKFGGGLASTFATSLTRALLGVESHELSTLFLVDLILSGRGLINIMGDLEDSAQYLRNANGNQSFASKLALKLRKDSIRLSHPVKSISQVDGNCIIETHNGFRYCSKKVLLSAPSNVYSQIQFSPALPPAKQELHKQSVMGHYSKTVYVFSSPWWREAGLSGAITSEDGPITFSRDTCVTELSQFSITCFHVGDPGRKMSELPILQRQKIIWDHFKILFQTAVNPVPEPINVIEKEWTIEPWIRGNPIPVMPPGLMTGEAGKAIRDPFKNIHFIGSETSLVWKGYMEGAVRSGTRGANEVIAKLDILHEI